METTDQSWKDEYVEKMFGIHSTDEEIQSALALKDQHIPKYLYKYRAIDDYDYSLNNFRDDKLWFNLTGEMNDPYDSAFGIDQELFLKKVYKGTGLEDFVHGHLTNMRKLGIPEDELKESEKELNGTLQEAREMLTNKFEEIKDEILSSLQDRTYISCFSERNDSLLMWSHYTMNHKGFCLEYEFMKPENIACNPIFKEALNPVIYDNKMLDMSEYVLHAQKLKQNWSQRIISNVIIRKAKDWEYEKEWRLIQYFPNTEKGYNLGFFKPKAIYLGTKISEKDKAKLMLIAESKRVDVYQMKMAQNAFKLIPHPEIIFSNEETLSN